MSKITYALSATFYDASDNELGTVALSGYDTFESCYSAAADGVRNGIATRADATHAAFVITSGRKKIERNVNPAFYICNGDMVITRVDYILPK